MAHRCLHTKMAPDRETQKRTEAACIFDLQQRLREIERGQGMQWRRGGYAAQLQPAIVIGAASPLFLFPWRTDLWKQREECNTNSYIEHNYDTLVSLRPNQDPLCGSLNNPKHRCRHLNSGTDNRDPHRLFLAHSNRNGCGSSVSRRREGGREGE